jgi:hypothetical protein
MMNKIMLITGRVNFFFLKIDSSRRGDLLCDSIQTKAKRDARRAGRLGS